MFTIKNYPKSYGCIKKNFYRLKDFQKEKANIEQIESKFWKFISSIAYSRRPRKVFNSHPFLSAGWEWSVFRKDNQSVIKIPAEIFPEVNEKKYLDNTRFAYQKILDYFPINFVAKTTFKRLGGLNQIDQIYVKGDKGGISYTTKNLELLENMRTFLESALEMLDDYQWLPDFDIQESSKGFRLRNVIFESNIPKIVDFTAYYDIYRLYPQRTKKEVGCKRKQIIDFLSWIKKG